MRKVLLAALATCMLVLLGSLTGAARQNPLGMLSPALSPDGNQLAFAYQGDVWVVRAEGGQARRLTVSTAYESRPVWSPDGERIAFISNRDGNYDIYVIPAAGGLPQRLTYHSGNDYVADWNPDGSKLLFLAQRAYWGDDIWELDIASGDERLVLRDQSGFHDARYSPDGSRILVSRGATSWVRKGYRGSAAMHLWTFDINGGDPRQLTDFAGSDFWPNWSPDGRFIYFIGDRNGEREVFRITAEGKGLTRVVGISGRDISFLDVARETGDYVCWIDGRLFRGELKESGRTDEPEVIPLRAGSDNKSEWVTRKVFHSASEMSVSPDGKWLATVVRGDIYIQPREPKEEEKAEVPRITEAVNFTENPARDYDIQWHPDSDRILFISDRDGNENLYVLHLNDRRVERLTEAEEIEKNPHWSPDGKQIAFFRGLDKLMVLEVESKRARELARGYFRAAVWPRDIAWSPHGKWLCYGSMDLRRHADLWIVPADGSEAPRNITQYPTWNYFFQWSSDDRHVAFCSYRGEVARVYLLDLTRKPVEFPDEMKFGEEKKEDEGDKKVEQEAKPDSELLQETGEAEAQADEENEEEEPPVEIDFRDIELRAVAVSPPLDSAGPIVFSPDGKRLLFEGSTTLGTQLWLYNLETKESSSTGVGMPFNYLEWREKGGAYGLDENGRVYKIDIAGDRIAGVSGVGVTAPMLLDRQAEILQMFDEAWRNLKQNFYDPDLHGRASEALYRKYRRMVEQAVTREEFRTFTWMLLGELNASHMGISGASSFEGIGSDTGAFGVYYDMAFPGPGLRVAQVLFDGPADRDGSRLHPGDIILEIEGEPAGLNEATWRLLDQTVGRTVHLKVLRAATNEEEAVRIRPVSLRQQRDLQYEQWVRDNRAHVEELSGGRIAYMHIRRMYEESLKRFERELFGYAQDYDAAIIDIRFNSGGHIHEELFRLLDRQPFGYSSRGRFAPVLQPVEAFLKPKLVIIHERCISDAEIFPYGFRQLGLGKLLGVQTYGGVIGTWTYELMDGTRFALPGSGWYTIDMQNMENYGVPPDVEVSLAPGDLPSGRDPQLEAAVKELLKELRGGKAASGSLTSGRF
ncbi:MAG: hypothetical protein B1H03_03155 [Planctomycetales bacterium 4484_113]|nr:MAG: hypothetical protein B1H03_03155 [Planctomycetales bacterium 4484_113]